MTNKSSRFCPTSSQSQYQLSKAILNELNHIFFQLFDYPQNEDLKMENEAYLFLAQLKEFFYFRDKWNEKQNKVFDILIERMRRELRENLGYVYRVRDYLIPVDHYKDLLKGYQKIFSSI